jgi:MinD-like ATPase involved in chromosome partitioning or flagellar assembly
MINLFKRASIKFEEPTNRSVCIWGPPGAPGKSTLALNLACELALAGSRVLLVDLDTYSPSLSEHFGLNDHQPGLAAAARLVGQDRLDEEQIKRLSVSFEAGKGNLSILTGLSTSSRWPEITRSKTEGLITAAKACFDYVVLDVGSPLEPAVRQVGGAVDRNIAARTALEFSDHVFAVLASDPIGVKRFLDEFERLHELAPDAFIIANRLRNSAIGARAKQQVEDLIQQHCRRPVSGFIPADFESCDRALFEMVPLAMMKRSSPARQAIAQLARMHFGASERPVAAHVAKLS